MSFLFKEYNLPIFGKIKLIQATRINGSFHGNYYVKNQEEEVICDKCDSPKELFEKLNEKIRGMMKINISQAKEIIAEQTEIKSKLENTLEEMDLLENSTNFENWLKRYQTENPLQLEYQKEKKL